MKIPEIGKLYHVAELDKYVVFRLIKFSSVSKVIKFDMYDDENRKQRFYDFNMVNRIKEEIESLTFTVIQNKSEQKRRPFDYITNIKDALNYILTHKRYLRTSIVVKFKKHIVIERQFWDYKERKTVVRSIEEFVSNSPIKDAGDNKILVSFDYKNSDIPVSIDNIKFIKIGLYKFTE